MAKANNKRVPIWFPYTSHVEVKKSFVRFIYKGGDYSTDINRVLSIMFYGAVCDLSENFLQLCARNRVPICIHRRNMPNAIWITPSITTSAQDDILTQQILYRSNQKKGAHIARKLLQAKFKSMEWLVAYPFTFVDAYGSVEKMRNIEAQHAKAYWQKYFRSLGYGAYSRRGTRNEIQTILNAVSKLIGGVILRYIIYHNMSPYHGFVHTPTSYPALVYDLMEPYRGYIDKVVFNTVKYCQENNYEKTEYLARCVTGVENHLDDMVYTDTTRQIVTFQELLHGITLALRAYLHKESAQFIVPIPGKPNGGRPVKVGYKLYGRSAGPTDFWQVAQSVATSHERKMTSLL